MIYSRSSLRAAKPEFPLELPLLDADCLFFNLLDLSFYLSLSYQMFILIANTYILCICIVFFYYIVFINETSKYVFAFWNFAWNQA